MKKMFILLAMFSIGSISASDSESDSSGSGESVNLTDIQRSNSASYDGGHRPAEEFVKSSVRCNFKTHFVAPDDAISDSAVVAKRAIRGKKEKTVRSDNVDDVLNNKSGDLSNIVIAKCQNLKENSEKIEGSVSGTKGMDGAYRFYLASADIVSQFKESNYTTGEDKGLTSIDLIYHYYPASGKGSNSDEKAGSSGSVDEDPKNDNNLINFQCNFKTHLVSSDRVTSGVAKIGKKKETVLIKNGHDSTAPLNKKEAVSQCRNLKKNGKKIEGSVSGTKGANGAYQFYLAGIDAHFSLVPTGESLLHGVSTPADLILHYTGPF